MMPAHIANRELERQRAERSAEIARQLPLYVEEPAYREPPVEGSEDVRREPDWTSNY